MLNKSVWNKRFLQAPKTLAKMSKIKNFATGFNACIDAVIKVSGQQLAQIIQQQKISLIELQNIKNKQINSVDDLLKGIFHSFSHGIAEEWIVDDIKVYDWMKQNLPTDKMQMGGQAGIIANTLAVTGIKQVISHNNALPKIQAEQFLPYSNLLSFDESGKLLPAHQINRLNDNASIHWIIEFDKGDNIIIDNQNFICPKSNRFIATYDPLLFNFIIDENFVSYTKENPIDYFVLSGYQALTEKNNGKKLIKNTIPIIKQWKKRSPKSIIHLELASTQDSIIRKAILKDIVPLVDSLGVNERETIDILEVINNQKLAEKCNHNPNIINMFEAVLKIKNKLKCPRIQLHMFGLYLTIQNIDFPISAKANRNGMILAATAAASKAEIGHIKEYDDILSCVGTPVSDIGLTMLQDLSRKLQKPELLKDGICRYKDLDIIVTPTIIVEKPNTLVGMGDTISSFSLIGAL